MHIAQSWGVACDSLRNCASMQALPIRTALAWMEKLDQGSKMTTQTLGTGN